MEDFRIYTPSLRSNTAKCGTQKLQDGLFNPLEAFYGSVASKELQGDVILNKDYYFGVDSVHEYKPVVGIARVDEISESNIQVVKPSINIQVKIW